jgi:drug/metabolite transporter (DMT)-like permease
MLSAAANAVSNVLQRKAGKEEPPELSMRPRLLVELARRPVWLGGFGLVIVSFVLMTAALDMGRLAAVQPILILELPMSLLLASRIFSSPLRAREWTAAVAMTAGLAGLIAFLAPSGGGNRASGLEWAVACAVTIAPIVFCVLASYTGGAARKPALLGVAAGISFGLTAAFMKAMTESFHEGVVGVLTTWQSYALVVGGTGAMFLMQNALHAGNLIAAQPGLTLVDPAVAMLWGIFVFGEHVRGGAWLACGVMAGVLLAIGVFILVRSPLLEGLAATDEDRARERVESLAASSSSAHPSPRHG